MTLVREQMLPHIHHTQRNFFTATFSRHAHTHTYTHIYTLIQIVNGTKSLFKSLCSRKLHTTIIILYNFAYLFAKLFIFLQRSLFLLSLKNFNRIFIRSKIQRTKQNFKLFSFFLNEKQQFS